MGSAMHNHQTSRKIATETATGIERPRRERRVRFRVRVYFRAASNSESARDHSFNCDALTIYPFSLRNLRLRYATAYMFDANFRNRAVYHGMARKLYEK